MNLSPNSSEITPDIWSQIYFCCTKTSLYYAGSLSLECGTDSLDLMVEGHRDGPPMDVMMYLKTVLQANIKCARSWQVMEKISSKSSLVIIFWGNEHHHDCSSMTATLVLVPSSDKPSVKIIQEAFDDFAKFTCIKFIPYSYQRDFISIVPLSGLVVTRGENEAHF